MGNANAGAWRYTAAYGWNWRSARAISRALLSLALPMPSWFRAVVARCLLTRTALYADAQGIWGSAGTVSAAQAGPCPWKDVTDIAVGKPQGLLDAAPLMPSGVDDEARPVHRRTLARAESIGVGARRSGHRQCRALFAVLAVPPC